MGPPHGALFPEKNVRGFAAKIFFRLHDRGGPMGPQIYDLYVLYTQKYVVFLEFSESGNDLSEFYG